LAVAALAEAVAASEVVAASVEVVAVDSAEVAEAGAAAAAVAADEGQQRNAMRMERDEIGERLFDFYLRRVAFLTRVP
jgi:hypothetical protein